MPDKSKFFLRSRAVQAALILLLQAGDALAQSFGLHLPAFLTLDWLTGLLNAVTGDAGLGAALIDAYAAALLVWKLARPDGAALVAVPGAGTLPLAAPLRAALLVLIVIGGPGLAFDARADTLPVYVPSAPVIGRWTWTPAENATAYNVYASRNGGAYTLAAAVTAPEATISSRLGETVEVRVEPLAPGSGAAPGPLSDVSATVRFLASPDLDGSAPVSVADVTRASGEFGRCITFGARGTAVPSGPCAP